MKNDKSQTNRQKPQPKAEKASRHRLELFSKGPSGSPAGKKQDRKSK